MFMNKKKEQKKNITQPIIQHESSTFYFFKKKNFAFIILKRIKNKSGLFKYVYFQSTKQIFVNPLIIKILNPN